MTRPKAAIIGSVPSGLAYKQVLVRVAGHGDLVLRLTVEPDAEVGLEPQPGLAASVSSSRAGSVSGSPIAMIS